MPVLLLVCNESEVIGSFRSLPGAEAYAVIHSIADTARKNNQSPFFALKSAADC
jgi:hypothetical protein